MARNSLKYPPRNWSQRPAGDGFNLADDWIKFRDDEVRLQLHALAHNLATFMRCIEPSEDWLLTSPQLKLIKIGARVLRHARAISFQFAEVAVTGHGPCHPCRDPPIASAAVMSVTSMPTQTEQMRQGASVHHEEKRRRRTSSMRVHGPICPHSRALAHADDAWRAKYLISHQNQAA